MYRHVMTCCHYKCNDYVDKLIAIIIIIDNYKNHKTIVVDLFMVHEIL